MKRHHFFILSFILILTIIFTHNTFAQSSKEPLHTELSKSLGFVMGQRFTLNRIKIEYPELSLYVKKAELEFDSAFGIAEKNIEKLLRNYFKDKYPLYIASLKEQLEHLLKSQQLNQDISIKFIKEVESRAKGKILSPILETFLIYQYKNRPVNEFLRGFKKTYSTKGHAKSKDLELQIEYPKSWSSREGKRPNIIQFFHSNNGRGPAAASIMVRDFVKEAQGQLTREELKSFKTLEGCKKFASEIFSENGLKEIATGMGMTNVRIISTKRMVMARWPGAMLEFTGDMQRLDLTTKTYNRFYFALYKNYFIILSCQMGKLPNVTESELKAKISLFTPIFHIMANSLMIQNQY